MTSSNIDLTGSGEPEVENRKSRTGSGEPEVENRKWRTGGPEPEVENQKWRTGSGEPEVENRKWRTGGPGHAIGSPENVMGTKVNGSPKGHSL